MTEPEPTTISPDAWHLYEISRIVTQSSDWNHALDQIVPLIRTLIIFDNLAVYLADPIHQNLDVMYARAVGRGRSAEADITWGEELATYIMDHPETTVREPENDSARSRLERPFQLGIPLCIGKRPLGAVIFIRFGGPPFSPRYIQLAEFIAQQISLLVERQNLQRAYDLLEAQSQEARLQEDFISTITHELRTPLGFIKGYTTTLLRSDTTWDQPTQQEFLKIIDQETDRLQELIENLLDSARLQSGTLRMEFQAVRLDTLVRSVIERTRLHHPEFNAQLECTPSPLPTLQGDPKRLAQVFENLFSNAIKYAPGSEVWVKINFNDREAFITVEDHGPGIPNRFLPHLFERFFRNPEVAPSVHGSGLGLFICKKIILAHQGNIHATSIVGQGTTFHITLPRALDRGNLESVLREEP
ncbi:MAG TPA: hypothetical protein DEQ80_00665 [Anaerolinea thermolimosa]|uniref:histidine kinase n=1 Tax=Anaerolinea thermolimosa TaxID=229919 RepID=A0A3D1JFG5_9CHLR|nr:GAF domain-containing sensor histidine kinase [Anaerolinea thermolimosa]GAP05706.1 histidine kinase [Anaerolinea thermolimosa]HCE16346.1 hypothetical protein [Anaerolinea thermolimosa]